MMTVESGNMIALTCWGDTANWVIIEKSPKLVTETLKGCNCNFDSSTVKHWSE